MKKCKVRFAPSPTGPLHIGGARSALYNYLFAVHQGGKMLLRIEDTDLERSRREYEKEIIESLRWLGIDWDEGIGRGGDEGPYRQTERLAIYHKYLDELLGKGKAYYCFCSEEELEQERQNLLGKGLMPQYSGKCSHLSQEEVNERLQQGLKPAIRFRVPPNQVYIVNDLVRGQVSFESENSGDFIIAKSDGLPTYNFAVVIDDVLMGISHVIRAEEHLSNTPRQLMIYDALNLPRPEFAHISLILGDDRQKMSKRHGATSLVQYRERGYLPEALFNFLALLGWSPEGEEEILSREAIIKSFSLERVSKSPAVFDINKLNWINAQYIKQTPLEVLIQLLKPYLMASEYSSQVKALEGDKLTVLVEALRDRLVCLADVQEYLALFFAEPEYEPEAREVLQGEATRQVLEIFAQDLPRVEDPPQIKQFIKGLIKKTRLKPAQVYMPLRSALTGKTHGLELPYFIYIWGREESIRRIEYTRAQLSI